MQSLLVKGEGGLLRIELVESDAGRNRDSTVPQTVGEESLADAGPLRRCASLGISHTANFAIVKWGRETFEFTWSQARIIEALTNAYGQGYEWLDQSTLLECADSDGSRLDHLFKGHPAWGRFIVRATSIANRPSAFALVPAI